MVTKKKKLKDWIIFLVIVLIIVGGSLYYVYFFTPKNSLELYRELTFADNFEDVQKLLLDGYENNFAEEDFNYIQGNTAKQVGQFTIFDYNNKSYLIMTSPGTERLKVLAVEELPDDIRRFFSELMK
ncbi:hypothetical protein QGM71_12540 [Virgibacillus sp. C22-A2]|uniref:DUF3139 domain-containing protein n=1 Tax=Virgibacillus tibetensis TaxID=3042313 RepID=A0ABU6KHF2_9BACI|nr:hypothetical protein [Virgibacillus sp. C22-A2]